MTLISDEVLSLLHIHSAQMYCSIRIDGSPEPSSTFILSFLLTLAGVAVLPSSFITSDGKTLVGVVL
jgi:hypothetical protein